MIPSHTKNAIDGYVEHGIPPSHFLQAVLTNDLFEAVARADDLNKVCLADICVYIYNFIPASAWGSPAKVNEWLRKHREEPASLAPYIAADREGREKFTN